MMLLNHKGKTYNINFLWYGCNNLAYITVDGKSCKVYATDNIINFYEAVSQRIILKLHIQVFLDWCLYYRIQIIIPGDL